MIKFRTGGYGCNLIEQVEIDHETQSNVYIGKYRNAKRSNYLNYFDTWEEAFLFLLELAENEASHARRLLEVANGKIGNIRGLKKP